jgi:uncharacterized protein (DUF1330 family)
MEAALAALPRIGRVVLVDLVRAPSHEARLAFPLLQRDVVARAGGRVAWAGSIDQQLIGHGLEHFQDVLISELPTAQACVRALAERREWKPETFVSEIATWAARPWSGWQAAGARVAFGALRLLGGGPTPARDTGAAEQLATGGDSPLEPDRGQLEQLLAGERDGRVVMLNFLRFRMSAAADAGSAPAGAKSGRAAYASYGRATAAWVGRMGGRLRYSARSLRALTGGPESPWDDFAAVEYPSRAAFLGMLADPRYRAVLAQREAGLDSTRLLVCTAHAAYS